MPPTKRTPIEEPTAVASASFLKVGDIVNIISHGRTLQAYEVLGMDDRFIKFRADMSVAPQTEVVLLPYAQIEAIGLVNER